jgi:Na+:H+ antiporter, NhaA family
LPDSKRPIKAALRPLGLLAQPFQKFAALESSGSILLMGFAILGMVLANSSLHPWYEAVKGFPLHFTLGTHPFGGTLLQWVNDGLMTFFFLLAGLEIKRERLAGELASWKKSLLPMAAALGGMLVPAGIFGLFNHNEPSAHGWGIPMATDIAFALGAMQVLGKRVPLGLKVFLVALAIIDDIGAIVVIAVFYAGEIHAWWLAGAAGIVGILVLLPKLRVAYSPLYLFLGALLWIALHHGGVHATLTGVLLAFTIPYKPQFEEELTSRNHMTNTMLLRWESALHPYVSFSILPLFAGLNAGVAVSFTEISSLIDPLGLGIILGLALGKPIGITLASWIAIRLKWGELPDHVNWGQMWGAGLLGGIGFTMSLFVSNLGLNSEAMISEAKLSIVVGSTLSCLLGLLLLGLLSLRKPSTD